MGTGIKVRTVEGQAAIRGGGGGGGGSRGGGGGGGGHSRGASTHRRPLQHGISRARCLLGGGHLGGLADLPLPLPLERRVLMIAQPPQRACRVFSVHEISSSRAHALPTPPLLLGRPPLGKVGCFGWCSAYLGCHLRLQLCHPPLFLLFPHPL
jgi:hypothetical protein